jgi:glucuronosyltransferase
LVNSHPITNSPHANLPNVIEVGGIHLTPAKPLDKVNHEQINPILGDNFLFSAKELQEYLENASNGVILLSLGSLISKDNMDPERLHTLTEAMAQLNEYSILWRWDTEDVPNLPSNVKIMPWVPQRDVLGTNYKFA